MTASPINAPSALNAVAAPGAAQGLFGASQAAAAQGPLAGFDALLAAFFGGQGQAEPGAAATLGAAKTKDGTKIAGVGADADADAKEKDAADGAETLDTPALSTDAQVLAALLAQPIPLTPAPAAGEAAPVEAAESQNGGTAAAFAPQLPDQAAAMAQAALAAKGAKTADASAARAAVAADAAVEAEADATTDATAEGTPTAAKTAPGQSADLSPAEAPRPAARAAAPPPAAPQAAPPPHQAAAPPPAAVAAAAAPPPVPVPVADAPASAVAQAEGAETAEAAAPLGEPAPAPTPGRGRAAARAARNESGRGEAAATPSSAANVDQAAQPATAQVEAAAGFESGAEGKSEDKAPAIETKAVADDAAQPAAPGVGDPAAIAAAPAAPAEVRAGPQTVAHLAAQIVKKLEGRSTQFDVALNPEGLGQVDVRIEIGAQGRLTASMSFENAHAANELRGRAGELQKALEQAGFDVSGGIRFDVAADRGQGQAGQGQFGQDPQNNGGAWRGRAFQAALDSADQTADAALSGALNLQRRTQSGVDVRI